MARVLGPFSLDRMASAVADVGQRLLRVAAALETARVPYAVAGDGAVAFLVSSIDKAAVRIMQDVDVLVRRTDRQRAKVALEQAGFVYRHTAGMDIFLDGP